MIKQLDKIVKDVQALKASHEANIQKMLLEVQDEKQKKVLTDAFELAKSGKADIATLTKMLQKLA